MEESVHFQGMAAAHDGNRNGDTAVIHEADFRRFLKGHDPMAVHQTIWIDAQRQRLERVDARSGAEEVAQRGLDGLPAVEADLDDQRPQGRLDLVLGQITWVCKLTTARGPVSLTATTVLPGSMVFANVPASASSGIGTALLRVSQPLGQLFGFRPGPLRVARL